MSWFRSILTLLFRSKSTSYKPVEEGSAFHSPFDISRYCGVCYERYRSTEIPFESGSNITATIK